MEKYLEERERGRKGGERVGGRENQTERERKKGMRNDRDQDSELEPVPDGGTR